MKNKIMIFAVSIAVLVAAFSFATMKYNEKQQEQTSFLANKFFEVFVRDYSPRYGAEEAKVFLTEYLDPECESCRKFYPEVKSLLKEFEGKVQLVVRYAPFHKNSKVAIKALEAARMQGKYWESMEYLFEKQPEWGNHHNPRPELIFVFLEELGLDMKKLKNDMESPKINLMIQQDMEDLQVLNVRGTPSFYVNGKPLAKFGIPGLRELLKQEVDKLY